MLLEIELNFHVSKNCFRPVPKNILLSLKNQKLLNINEINNYCFFKNLFSHKRKSLRNLFKKTALKISLM